MTEILPWGSLGAVSKEEDLNWNPTNSPFLINPPPSDGRCMVCGRHMSELKPFGGAGDPLVGDFSGELLVKRWRLDHPTNEEAEKAWEEADKLMKVPASDDTLPWFIAKYGEEKGTKFYWYRQNSIGASWECRDCIVLDQYEYFEKSNRTWEEQRVRNLGRFDELVKEKWLTEEEKPLFEQFVEFHPVRHDFEDFLKDWEIFKSRKATEEAVISR